jgi:signal transduction histidine kinase
VEGLTDPRVRVIAPGPVGSLWIGTPHGLNRFDPASKAVERILPDARDPSALASGYVSTLVTDHRGRLWVGIPGHGIDVMEGRGHDGRPRFHHLGVAQGLANDVDMLLADSRGEIWASTDDGLALIDPASFKIRTLGRAEGIVFPNYWLRAGTVTDVGDLVFGGIGGLTVVRLDRLKPWAYQPPVVVTDVHIGGKWVPSSHLNPGSRGQEPLTITPGGNSIAIEFAALDYSAPERNRYAYKLEGFDKDWTETDPNHRVAAYTNLTPGDYRLRVRGSNRDGVWNDAGLTVPIRVLPAWFQTVTFKVLASFVLLGLLTFAYRVRIRYIAERLQERHRARLAERDRIARELHDTLLQSTEGLILKVHSVVNRLSLDNPDRALLSAALDRASELAYEGRERIQGLREGGRPRAELGHVLEKAAREMAQGTAMRFELKLEGPVRELRPYIWEELYRIAYEALWNAYRHACASLITVSVSYGDRELHILIGDDGRGIEPGMLQSAVAGGHFGLAGMRERARGMKARLHIESSEGGGTRVDIRINSLLSYVAH